MSRPWRTVYKSANKQVMIRPSGYRQSPRRSSPNYSVQSDSGILGLLYVIFYLLVILGVIVWLIEILSFIWPFLIIALVIFVLAGCR